MRVIAFLSNKGGVGKSTACLNLGAALADMGRRVLIADLDASACISRTLTDIPTAEESVAAALVGARPLNEITRETPIPKLSIAPGTFALRTIGDVDLAGETPSERVNPATGRLSETALVFELGRLSPAAYDFVLLDCPGGHPFMERAALLACDEVIVPTGLSVYDLYAVTPTLRLITEARRLRGNGAPRFLGFLPNGASARGVPDEVRERLASYQLPMFSPIRQSVMLKSGPGREKVEQRVVTRFRRNSAVAESVRQVAREIDLGLEAARAGDEGRMSSNGMAVT